MRYWRRRHRVPFPYQVPTCENTRMECTFSFSFLFQSFPSPPPLLQMLYCRELLSLLKSFLISLRQLVLVLGRLKWLSGTTSLLPLEIQRIYLKWDIFLPNNLSLCVCPSINIIIIIIINLVVFGWLKTQDCSFLSYHYSKPWATSC